MTAAQSELSMDFSKTFRKFDLGQETAIRGDLLFGSLIEKSLTPPPALEYLAGSGDQQKLLSFIVFAFQMVLYRNSYQAEFDSVLVDLRLGQPGTQSGVWLSSFNADTYSLTAETISHNDSLLNLGSMTAARDSDALIFLADIDQKIIDHEFLKQRAPLLALVVRQDSSTVSLTWLFRESVVVNQIVAQLEKQLGVLIAEMLAWPTRRLIDLKIISDIEVETNSRFLGRSVTSDFVALNELVEQFAHSQPDKIAVHHNSKSLSYAELVEHGKQLSRSLRRSGVKKGDTVAAFLEPSEWTLVAILGIHHVGAVYVPIDPSFPADRIGAILDEVLPVLIVSNTNTEVLSQRSNAAIRNISELVFSDPLIGSIKLVDESGDESLVVDPDAISHIFFTSGTTGRPKGVVSTHRNLTHYIESAINQYGFNANDRFVAAARFTFSISLFELLVPLAVGASVEILPRSSVLDMKSLAAAVERATVFHFGPSLLKKLLPFIRDNYPSLKPFSNLHHVSSGGDLIPPEVLEGLKEIFSNAEVFVIYGCSEISCMGSTYHVPRDQQITKTKVGKPMQNMEIRILDGNGNHVPRGIAGHVHFCGAGLVKEYLDQPELTAKKFHLLDGLRFYNTGDIGRIDANGNLELLGRDDFQVKIRGVRIEIQEIEQWLKQHPLISDCVVVANTLNGDERYLVAYLVTKSKAINSAELIKYLSEKIPDFMVPSIYVALEALPLNHNGKLDRAQLPAPNKDNILLSTEFQQAEDDVEEFLIGAWERIFSLKGIGIDHNFFEVGGDSLSAVQILTEIETKYQRLLSFGDFLDDPTVRNLAKKIRDKLARPPEETKNVVLFRKGPDDKPPIFLLDAVLLYKDFAKALDCNRTVYALYLPEDAQKVKDVIYQHRLRFNSIISSYVAQIRTLQANGPYIICGHSFGGLIALEVSRQLQADGDTVQLLALIDTWCPGFRYNMGPLLRVIEHCRLAFTYGWSYVGKRLKRTFGRIRKALSSDAEPAATDNHEEIDLRWLVVTLMDGKTFIPARYDEPVLLFKAKTRGEFQPPSRYLGWKDTLTSVAVHEVSGSHYGMLETENVEQMARTIMTHIGEKPHATTY